MPTDRAREVVAKVFEAFKAHNPFANNDVGLYCPDPQATKIAQSALDAERADERERCAQAAERYCNSIRGRCGRCTACKCAAEIREGE